MPLPDPKAALALAGLGRLANRGRTLLADATARRLLGLPARPGSVSRWIGSLPTEFQAHWLQAWEGGGAARSLRVRLDGPLGPVDLQARVQEGRFQAVIAPAWASEPEPGPPLPAWSEAMVAEISHELRTPLNAIIGFGRLAREEGPGPQGPRYLGQIDQAAQLMLRVVNDLLDLARLEAGRLEIDSGGDLWPASVLGRVGEFAPALLQDRPVRLELRLDPACPARLRGDAQRLEQVLLNLLANAARFTDRGRIVVGAQVRRRRSDHVTVRWSVADTGIGIPLERLTTLGRRFEQVRDEALRQRGGSGLGLAVVRHLLAMHGTELRLASVRGGGTIAWFELEWPVHPSPVPPPPEPDTAAISLDPGVVSTLDAQWRAGGQILAPSPDPASRWLLDAEHPQADDWRQRARREGRALWTVRSGRPLEGELALALAGAHLLSLRGTPIGPVNRLQGLRVLVVDDNAMNRELFATVLQRHGAQPALAIDGASALALARLQSFDAALLDIQLPDIHGIALGRSLRALPRRNALPLIFVSARIDPADAVAAAGLGALACLPKPFDPDRLLALLDPLARSVAGEPPEASVPVDVHAWGPAATMATAAATIDLRAAYAREWPSLRDAILGAPDAAVRARAVHMLRGALAWMGDPDAVDLARRVEDGLRAGRTRLPLKALLTAAARLAST